jgi:hypothetical protein
VNLLTNGYFIALRFIIRINYFLFVCLEEDPTADIEDMLDEFVTFFVAGNIVKACHDIDMAFFCNRLWNNLFFLLFPRQPLFEKVYK